MNKTGTSFLEIARYFGIGEALLDLVNRFFSRFKKIKRTARIYETIDNWTYPVCIRLNTSDEAVLSQILDENEYCDLEDIEDVRLVIDCGGYTGLSSLWFLHKYEQAHVITLEPDPDNFIICRRNLKFYNNRLDLLNAAIWPTKGSLTLTKGHSHWATRVAECGCRDEGRVNAIDVDSLINQSGFETIDILKIDIEGAERELFSDKFKKWLPRVRNMAIELHDKTCENIFFGALSNYKYELFKRKDLTICKNLSNR